MLARASVVSFIIDRDYSESERISYSKFQTPETSVDKQLSITIETGSIMLTKQLPVIRESYKGISHAQT